MSSGNNLVLSVPDETGERQEPGADVQHSPGRLFRRAGIDNSDAAVVRDKGEDISTRRERDSMHPPGSIVEKLATDGVEWKAFTPCGRLRTLIHTLDVAGEHSGV